MEVLYMSFCGSVNIYNRYDISSVLTKFNKHFLVSSEIV